MKPDTDTIWAWLDEVPDPEIPVISVVDLGIIRDVVWDGDVLEVAITPTYSGCPATSIINLDVEPALARRRPQTLPALPVSRGRESKPVRLHPLQGPLALSQLS